MPLTPLIAIHMSAALAAIAIGPLALWARLGTTPRPRLHRAAGYAWVTLMMMTAASAIFIDAGGAGSWGRFSIIHLLIPVTLGMLVLAFWLVFKGNIAGHRRVMRGLYGGACLVAGGFTLLPGRYLGDLVLGQWLGLL